MTDKLYHECHELISQSRVILEDLKTLGYETITSLPVCHETPEVPQAECRPGVENIDLEQLQQQIQGCTRCTLSKGRNNIVFGSGNPEAEVVLVGEAPGREEDIKGYPFVGEAGRLLEKYYLPCI